MTPQFLTVQNKGIFHSLPTFPEHDGRKYTAIVTGANGLSGSHIVDVLAEAPERWGTIYAMSRRAPASTRSNIKNIAADFLTGTPEDLAESFKKQGVTALVPK
jgi:nucleoside-diphosphate-sugar epimerase